VIVGQLLAALVVSREGRKRAAIAALVFAVVLLPWVPTVISQMGLHYTNPSTSGSGAASAIGLAWQTVQLSLFRAPLSDRPSMVIAVLGLTAATLAARFQGGCSLTPGERILVLAAAFPFVILFALSITSFSLVEDRHRIPVVLGALSALALWLGNIPVQRVRAALSLMTIAYFAALSVSYQRHPDVNPDWPGAVRHVAAADQGQAPIFVMDMDCALPFEYYARRLPLPLPLPNSVHGLPIDDPWGPLQPVGATNAIATMPLHQIMLSSDSLGSRISSIVPRDSAFWTMTRDYSYRRLGGDTVIRYLNGHAERIDQLHLTGLTLTSWRNTPPDGTPASR
jgi:hypothetical protein